MSYSSFKVLVNIDFVILKEMTSSISVKMFHHRESDDSKIKSSVCLFNLSDVCIFLKSKRGKKDHFACKVIGRFKHEIIQLHECLTQKKYLTECLSMSQCFFSDQAVVVQWVDELD